MDELKKPVDDIKAILDAHNEKPNNEKLKSVIGSLKSKVSYMMCILNSIEAWDSKEKMYTAEGRARIASALVFAEEERAKRDAKDRVEALEELKDLRGLMGRLERKIGAEKEERRFARNK